jgi:hypothetical protein
MVLLPADSSVPLKLDSAPKKAYTCPKLETYGTVAEITQDKGGVRVDDGGNNGRPNTKH